MDSEPAIFLILHMQSKLAKFHVRQSTIATYTQPITPCIQAPG